MELEPSERLEYSDEFVKKINRLPQDIQQLTIKQLALLLENPRHPSLKTKKREGHTNLWQGRISRAYRFLFEIGRDHYFLHTIFHKK